MPDFNTHTRELTIHPVADIMPPLSEIEFDALVSDIRRNGQINPIIVHNNQIIDGRHRYWACNQLSIEPITAPWNGPTDEKSLVECVISLNVQRRHLTTSQRAALAANALPFFEEQAALRMSVGRAGLKSLSPDSDFVQATDPINITPGESREHVAKLFAVSPRYVTYAKNIKEWSDDVFQDVIAGNTTIAEAARILRSAESTPEPNTEHADAKKTKHAKKTELQPRSERFEPSREEYAAPDIKIDPEPPHHEPVSESAHKPVIPPPPVEWEPDTTYSIIAHGSEVMQITYTHQSGWQIVAL